MKEVTPYAKTRKVESVKEITADLKATEIYYFVDYRGLTFSEATDLRARLAKADATLKVVKNTLAKRAAADAGIEGIDELLKGPTAIAYCHGDPVQVAKIIQEFIKEKKKAAIRGGKLQRSAAGVVRRRGVGDAAVLASSSSPSWWVPWPRRSRASRTF